MLSPVHQTIFVHVPKTAGQSIEMVFLQDLGLDWATRAPLLLRPNEDRQRGPERLGHLFAWEYTECRHVSPEDFDRFFRFSVVRNPYDRAVSEYNYRKKPDTKTIRDFMSLIPDDTHDDRWRHMCPQHYFLMDAAREAMMVDEVLKFETLQQDWPRICEKIFGRPRTLLHQNRSKPLMRREDLSKEDIDFIGETYRRDFELFGYEIL